MYSLAATAFTLLTGEPPTGRAPVVGRHRPEQAAQLEEAIRLGLSTDPAKRPESAGELVERLRAGWQRSLPTGVLTFCLTDIVGSTAKWETRPGDMARSLAIHDDLIAAAAERHGGRFLEAQGEGDSTVTDVPRARSTRWPRRSTSSTGWRPRVARGSAAVGPRRHPHR